MSGTWPLGYKKANTWLGLITKLTLQKSLTSLLLKYRGLDPSGGVSCTVVSETTEIQDSS
jgi:hypothetical protein